MFDIIVDIMKERNSGLLRICFVKQWPGSSVSDAAKQMGLNADPATYQSLSSDDATSIITWILHKDLAYGQEIIPADRARRRALSLVQSLPSSASFYYNGNAPKDLGISIGWSPATDATFDGGIIALCGEFCFGIWVEDED